MELENLNGVAVRKRGEGLVSFIQRRRRRRRGKGKKGCVVVVVVVVVGIDKWGVTLYPL